MTVKHTDFTSQEVREQLALLINHLAASQGTVMELSAPERREAVVNHAFQGALAVSLEVHQSEELVSLVLRMGGRLLRLPPSSKTTSIELTYNHERIHSPRLH